MSKRELIDAIRRHNHTVAPEFLARFAENDLKAYLDRMCAVIPSMPPPRRKHAAEARQELLVA